MGLISEGRKLVECARILGIVREARTPTAIRDALALAYKHEKHCEVCGTSKNVQLP